MARIGIVTDSTCDMGPAALAALDVEMVPLKVMIGDETYRDWIDLKPEDFYPKLQSASKFPTTSQPSPAEFGAAYEKLAAQGVEGIVSIHLSSKLSGTFESASLAADGAPVPVRMVDTTLVSWAMALILQAAVAVRDAGGDIDAVEKAAVDASAKTELYFVLDTLDYLVKGGRAGKAQGLAAALLNIKPVLEVKDGIVQPFAKARGAKAAFEQLSAHVAERSRELGGVKAVVIHALSPDLAGEISRHLVEAGLQGEIVQLGEIGAVIGTYAGPRAVGVTYLPA